MSQSEIVNEFTHHHHRLHHIIINMERTLRRCSSPSLWHTQRDTTQCKCIASRWRRRRILVETDGIDKNPKINILLHATWCQFRNGWLNTHQWKTRFSFGQNERRISNQRNNRIFFFRCRCHCVDWPVYINSMTSLAYICRFNFMHFYLK